MAPFLSILPVTPTQLFSSLRFLVMRPSGILDKCKVTHTPKECMATHMAKIVIVPKTAFKEEA